MLLEETNPFAPIILRGDDGGGLSNNCNPKEAKRVGELIYLAMIYGDADEAHRLVDEFSRKYIAIYDETTRLSDVLERALWEPLKPSALLIGDVLGLDKGLTEILYGAEFVERVRLGLHELGFEWT